MLQSSVGSLTVVDPNLPTAKVYWNGEPLEWLLSFSATINRGVNRTVIRVVKPSKVSPPLDAAEQLRLNDLYDAMGLADIHVHKV